MLYLTALLPLLFLPFTQSQSIDSHPTFRLRPDPSVPEVADLGFLPTSIYYPAGPDTSPDLHLFYDTSTNTVNATDPAKGILFARPTHGTPMYFLRLGDPFSDAVPALTLWDIWRIETKTREEDGKEVTRDWLEGIGFMACFSGMEGDENRSVNIYAGPYAPLDYCTDLFQLEVVWDEDQQKTSTSSAISTITLTPDPTSTGEQTEWPTPTSTITATDITSVSVTSTTKDAPPTYTTVITSTPIGTGVPAPSPTSNETIPTASPTEPPVYDGGAGGSGKAGSLVVAIAVAVAFFGL